MDFCACVENNTSNNLPKSAIEEVQVITGGLPASYGDATGGIVSITTRGPSVYTMAVLMP